MRCSRMSPSGHRTFPYMNAVLSVVLLSLILTVPAHSRGPTKTGKLPALPAGFFLRDAPANFISVGEARKVGQVGRPVVVRGRIGGLAKPIADRHAIFVISDHRLPLCQEGCASPWDYCCTPREQIRDKVATVQVVDINGRPLKVSLDGVNGLKPASDVIVLGTVAQKGKNFMIVNAKSIHVVNPAKSAGKLPSSW